MSISYSGAEAQTKSATATTKKVCTCAPDAKKTKGNTASAGTAKTSETYQVCQEHGGYYTCCVHHRKAKKTVTTSTAAADAVPAKAGGTKTVTTKTVVTKVATK